MATWQDDRSNERRGIRGLQRWSRDEFRLRGDLPLSSLEFSFVFWSFN